MIPALALVAFVLFVLLVVVCIQRDRFRNTLETQRRALAAADQDLANLHELRDDARALAKEKTEAVQAAALLAERLRIAETALREVLPVLRSHAAQLRTGTGTPIPSDEWSAVVAVEEALGIQSEG